MANYRLRIGFNQSYNVTVTAGDYLFTGFAAILSKGGAVLSWIAPSIDEQGGPITPSGYIVYANTSNDDWAGGLSQNTGSTNTTYSWDNASFTAGTTWYFWVRAYSSSGAYSSALYLGSKSF